MPARSKLAVLELRVSPRHRLCPSSLLLDAMPHRAWRWSRKCHVLQQFLSRCTPGQLTIFSNTKQGRQSAMRAVRQPSSEVEKAGSLLGRHFGQRLRSCNDALITLVKSCCSRCCTFCSMVLQHSSHRSRMLFAHASCCCFSRPLMNLAVLQHV